MGTWSSMERDGKISTRRKFVSAKPGRVAHPLGQCFYWDPECLREASYQQVPRGDWTSSQKYDKNQDGFVYCPGTSVHEYKEHPAHSPASQAQSRHKEHTSCWLALLNSPLAEIPVFSSLNVFWGGDISCLVSSWQASSVAVTDDLAIVSHHSVSEKRQPSICNYWITSERRISIPSV